MKIQKLEFSAYSLGKSAFSTS